MPATKGNVSSASANSASLAWAHTLTAGATMLIVGAGLPSGITVTSVTWDADGVNESFTELRNDDNPGAAHTGIWYLLTPSAATGSSEITQAVSTMSRQVGGAVDFTGTSGAPDNATGSATDTTVSMNDTVSGVGADDYVFDSVRSDNGTVLTEGADQTADWNIQPGSGDIAGGGTQDGVNGGVMSWSWTGSGDAAHTACRIPGIAGAEPIRKRFDYQPYLVR